MKGLRNQQLQRIKKIKRLRQHQQIINAKRQQNIHPAKMNSMITPRLILIQRIWF